MLGYCIGEMDSGKGLEGKIDSELKKAFEHVLKRKIGNSDNPDDKKFGPNNEYSLKDLYSELIDESPVVIEFVKGLFGGLDAYLDAYLDGKVNTAPPS